jgi:hypothetical protein
LCAENAGNASGRVFFAVFGVGFVFVIVWGFYQQKAA